MSAESWLPGIIPYEGDWASYLLLIYSKYEEDFVKTAPVYMGNHLAVKRHPKDRGLDATFWHLIEKGKKDRTIDFRRCERIAWPRPIVEHCEQICIKIWENERGGEKRVCIWYESEKYIVILAKRSGYILFWTAYPIDSDHHEAKIRKDYLDNVARAATSDGSVTPSTRGR